jgi:hypothetical protein
VGNANELLLTGLTRPTTGANPAIAWDWEGLQSGGPGERHLECALGCRGLVAPIAFHYESMKDVGTAE